MASAERNLIVTSNLDGPDRLVSMSIESIESTASASASYAGLGSRKPRSSIGAGLPH